MNTEVARVTIDDAERPITLDLARGRIELSMNGHVAAISFRLAGERLAAAHTEVPDALRGKRIGDHLARALLEYVGREGLKVEPFCPFVAAYIKRHPEYAALVASDFAS